MLGSSSLMYLPLKGQGQVFLQGQQVNGFPLSFSFFPSLKCDLERLCKEHRSDILGKTEATAAFQTMCLFPFFSKE